MNMRTIVDHKSFHILGEALLREDGCYVLVRNGEVKCADEVYERKYYNAIITKVLEENHTGMMHDTQKNKHKYLGCTVSVTPAHMYGFIQVFYCYELKEYFTLEELEFVNDQKPT